MCREKKTVGDTAYHSTDTCILLYRDAHTRQEILDDLNNGIIAGKYDGIVADTFVRNYDEIMDKAAARAAAALVTHQKLMRNYNQVYRSLV